MKLLPVAAALGALILATGCDQCLMPQPQEVYAPMEEGLTLGYENPSFPHHLRLSERFQVRVKEAKDVPAGRLITATTTTMGGASEVTFIQKDGGLTLGTDPAGRNRILPKGFPDRVSRWEDRGVFHYVIGRASVSFPGVRLPEPGNALGVWVESFPVHGLGPHRRTFYVPGIGEAEILVFKEGQWQSVFRLVSRGFSDLPVASGQGASHE